MATTRNKAFAGPVLAVFGASALLVLAGCGSDSKQNASSPASQAGSTSASGETASTGGASGEAPATKKKEGADGDGKTTSADSSGGAAGSAPETAFKPEPTPIQLLTDGTSGVIVAKPTVRIAKSQGQLDALVKVQASATDSRPNVSANFNEERQVMALFMPKSKRGTQVTVTAVSSNGSKTRVSALLLVPKKGCKAKGPDNPRPTAWVETRRLPGRDVDVTVKRAPLSSC